MDRVVYDRIEGLICDVHKKQLQYYAQQITAALLEDGFDASDVKEYLTGVVGAEVDAVKSILK